MQSTNKRPRMSTETSNINKTEYSIDRDILINENKYLKKRLTDNLIELSNKDEIIARLQFEIENLKRMQKFDNLKGNWIIH